MRSAVVFFGLLLVLALTAMDASAQIPTSEPWPGSDPGRRRGEEDSAFLKEMLAKQQSAREKKEHRIMLERGEDALKIATQLDAEFEKTGRLDNTELLKLDELEKLALKIRGDLGGDDEDVAERLPDSLKERSGDLRHGVRFLKESTECLAAELKKTTRYSVSIPAIEQSNVVIRIVRALKFWN